MPDPYLSELKYLGGANVDFVEIAVHAGTDVSTIQVIVYNPGGSVRSTNALGSPNSSEAGRDIYLLNTTTSPTFNGLNRAGAVALVVDGTVTQFVSFDQVVTATAGPANGLSSDQIGTTARGGSLETDDNGSSYTATTSPTPGNVPCFVAGSLILTPEGARPVEDLGPGDLVVTADQGAQPILWAGHRTLCAAQAAHRSLHPICIRAHALGPNVPFRDLYVSPNHRMALSHPLNEVYFEASECLAAAKSLAGRAGVLRRPIAAPIVYHHLLFAQHQIIWANGARTESFHPGQQGLDSFPQAALDQITAAIGAPDDHGPTARRVLKAEEARVLLALAGADPLSPRAEAGVSVAA